MSDAAMKLERAAVVDSSLAPLLRQTAVAIDQIRSFASARENLPTYQHLANLMSAPRDLFASIDLEQLDREQLGLVMTLSNKLASLWVTLAKMLRRPGPVAADVQPLLGATLTHLDDLAHEAALVVEAARTAIEQIDKDRARGVEHLEHATMPWSALRELIGAGGDGPSDAVEDCERADDE